MEKWWYNESRCNFPLGWNQYTWGHKEIKHTSVDTLIYVDGAVIWWVSRENYNKSGMHDFIGTRVYRCMTAKCEYDEKNPRNNEYIITMKTFTTVDAYIAAQPREHQPKLITLRELINKLAPDAVEWISYGMPWYKYCGKPFVYFACAKNILASPDSFWRWKFKKNWRNILLLKEQYNFLKTKELPLQLIKKIIQFRMSEITS